MISLLSPNYRALRVEIYLKKEKLLKNASPISTESQTQNKLYGIHEMRETIFCIEQ